MREVEHLARKLREKFPANLSQLQGPPELLTLCKAAISEDWSIAYSLLLDENRSNRPTPTIRKDRQQRQLQKSDQQVRRQDSGIKLPIKACLKSDRYAPEPQGSETWRRSGKFMNFNSPLDV